MTSVEKWRNCKKTIEKSKRFYSHFDYRTDISKCWEYISDPNNIAKHSFYPFIHYVQKISKFSKTKGLKWKSRDICYASHMDRCIYQCYNFLLNSLYNDKCSKYKIDNVAVAYRTNLLGQSNIDFSKQVIDFIKKSRNCYIMIGDFTNFFDSLDHKYLKKQWCDLLGQDILPPDHYSVYKNISRYSKVELADLLAHHKLDDTTKGRRELNSKRRVLSPIQLREKLVPITRNTIGIPQGSPMSGVLANIYMLSADMKLLEYVSSLGGMYMRYSDDFIVILPDSNTATTIEGIKSIGAFFDGIEFPGLELQSSKTQYYHYTQNTITNIGKTIDDNADDSNPQLNFLGFKFDGKNVSLRDKTVSKFYRRMRRKAKTISMSDGFTKRGNRISNEELYKKYSIRGASSKKGNFLTYVNRAMDNKRFGGDEPLNQVSKRNMHKLRFFLKKNYKN